MVTLVHGGVEFMTDIKEVAALFAEVEQRDVDRLRERVAYVRSKTDEPNVILVAEAELAAAEARVAYFLRVKETGIA
jgi:hypothetical protein